MTTPAKHRPPQPAAGAAKPPKPAPAIPGPSIEDCQHCDGFGRRGALTGMMSSQSCEVCHGAGKMSVPWCVPCKRHHLPPASKAEWVTLKCAGPNPFPAAKVPTAKVPRTPGDRDRAMAAKGRLPDGSRVAATYHAATETWIGELVIVLDPGYGIGVPIVVKFAAGSAGQYKLMAKLDALYREWLAAQAAKETP